MTASIRANGSASPVTVAAGATVNLANFDNAGVLGWEWTLLDKPEGSAAAIAGATASTANFVADIEGTYLVRLRTFSDLARTTLEGAATCGIAVLFGAPYAWRIPAAGETREFDGSKGWKPAVNAILRAVRSALISAVTTLQGAIDAQAGTAVAVDSTKAVELDNDSDSTAVLTLGGSTAAAPRLDAKNQAGNVLLRVTGDCALVSPDAAAGAAGDLLDIHAGKSGDGIAAPLTPGQDGPTLDLRGGGGGNIGTGNGAGHGGDARLRSGAGGSTGESVLAPGNVRIGAETSGPVSNANGFGNVAIWTGAEPDMSAKAASIEVSSTQDINIDALNALGLSSALAGGEAVVVNASDAGSSIELKVKGTSKLSIANGAITATKPVLLPSASVIGSPDLAFAGNTTMGLLDGTAFLGAAAMVFVVASNAGLIIVDAGTFAKTKVPTGGTAAEPGFAIDQDFVGLYREGDGLGITSYDGVGAGVQCAAFDASTGLASGVDTALLLRYHNGTAEVVQRVTVGAADSGGVGFRILRVPN